MSDFNTIFSGAGGKTFALIATANISASRTWVAPADGIVIVRAMGAGGGGAYGTGTGGYSGAWGVKTLRVKKGDPITIAIGAPGLGRTGSAGPGAAGGNTTVTFGGATYIAPGGPGGKSGTGAVPDGPAPSSNWDAGASSVKPGVSMVTNGYTGGAGVDILMQGDNATTSDSATMAGATGGGGTGGASVGVAGGGAIGIAAADGRTDPGLFLLASPDWGACFWGGSGSNGGTVVAGNGGGGSTGSVRGGGLGGGGGGGTAGAGGNGGLGGGGGCAVGGGGNGGAGYAHIKFFAEVA